MNSWVLFGVLTSGLVLSACSPEPENKPSSGNPLTAPVDYLGAVGQAKKRVEGTVSTASLQQAIQLFQAQEGRLPKTLEELVSEKYVPSIPTLPAGQKLQYNPSTGELKVVRQ